MGVEKFYKVFDHYEVKSKKAVIEGNVIGVDMSIYLYRANLGMKSIKGLTDSDGNSTLYLNTLLCNIMEFKRLGCKGLIYVFDNPNHSFMKEAENKKRSSIKEDALSKIEEEGDSLTEDRKNMLEKQTFTLTSTIVSNAKKLLNMLNIPYIVSEEGYEAEHVGAHLSKMGIIDHFLTEDSDTLLFGSKTIVRKFKYKYKVYSLDSILSKYDLTYEQFLHTCVMMGTDFNKKTKGMGVKSSILKGKYSYCLETDREPCVSLCEQVLSKSKCKHKLLNPGKIQDFDKDLMITQEQRVSKNYFKSKYPFTADMVERSGAEDKPGLLKFLIKKNFNEDRIKKILNSI